MSYCFSDTSSIQDKFCVEAIAIEPRVLVDGVWIPSDDVHVSVWFSKNTLQWRNNECDGV